MIKRSIHYERIAIINVYMCNNGVPKYMKEKLTKFKKK